MSRCCKDCGCKIYGGICSNCQEELYIFETQYDYLEPPLSDEFVEKVKEQKRKVRNKMKQTRKEQDESGKPKHK